MGTTRVLTWPVIKELVGAHCIPITMIDTYLVYSGYTNQQCSVILEPLQALHTNE